MTYVENKRLDLMEERLKLLNDKVDRVLKALEDDELNVDGGLITQFKDLKKRVIGLESLKNKVIWISIGAGAACGFSINKIIEWIQDAAR